MDFKELARSTALDTWICHHFKVLPTEERYTKLTDNQKLLLLTSFMENISSDDLYAYAKQKRLKKLQQIEIDKDESRALKALGYTDEQIDKMNDQIGKAGL